MFRFLHQTEDIMDTELTPTQMAIEFLRRDPTVMTPAQYLKKLKLLELEFADLMALSSLELKEDRSGLASGYPLSHSRWTVTGAANGPFFVPGWQQAKKSPARRGKISGSG